jgi:hypothetical protein
VAAHFAGKFGVGLLHLRFDKRVSSLSL